MYGWIFRAFPGPVWLKVILAVLVIAAIVLVLFEWVFPAVNDHFIDNTVG